MNTRETVKVGETYYIEHKSSTMATIASVLCVDGNTVEISGDRYSRAYSLNLPDFQWKLI